MVFRLIYNKTAALERRQASPESAGSVENCTVEQKRGSERGRGRLSARCHCKRG